MHQNTDDILKLAGQKLPDEIRASAVLKLIQLSLAEDLSSDAEFMALYPQIVSGDVTSAAILNEGLILEANIVAKAPGVVAGLPLAAAVFTLIDPKIEFEISAVDGSRVESGEVLASLSGSGSALLAGERTALNYLGRASGIATLTRKFVDAVAGTGAVILDTRKTAPGARRLDKYAVRMGGGGNHRMGLYDMVLIKDNHIDGAGGIRPAVDRVRQRYGHTYPIEVEVRTVEELKQAIALNPSRIMLDNMSLEMMRQAVEITAGRVALEASGNVSLENVRAIAETGVEYISVGTLTHSAPVFNLSMQVV
jgi:nicotinate-nucleotide pyrophosphorylase (carboxylating)